MFVGNFNRKRCSISAYSPNKSVCVTGISGSGKTCRLNQIELSNTNSNTTIVVLDLSHTHSEEEIFSPLRPQYLNHTNRISAVKDGFNLCIFQPLKNQKNEAEPLIHLINSAVHAFSSCQGMGVRQIAALREAVSDAIKYNRDFESDAQALDFCLSMRDDPQSKAVRERLWSLLNCGVLHPSDKNIIPGRINILDLSEIDPLTQASLSELILSSIWRNAQYGNLKTFTQNLIIVLDEFQDLPLKKDSMLRTMLREGRKFGISLILSTQTLAAFPKDVLALLDQTATKLYFRPAQNEALKIAKEINVYDTKEFAKQLLDLKVGECIAVGNLCIDGTPIQRPILLK